MMQMDHWFRDVLLADATLCSAVPLSSDHSSSYICAVSEQTFMACPGSQLRSPCVPIALCITNISTSTLYTCTTQSALTFALVTPIVLHSGGMSSNEPGGGSVGRSFRFSDAVQAITSSFKGHQIQGTKEGESSRSQNVAAVVVVDPAVSLDDSTVDSFPVLTEEHLRGTLKLGEEAITQMIAAYDESKLNWDLDPRIVGGHRSESNMGMARVFRMLSAARLVDANAASSNDNKAGSDTSYRDSSGNVVPAPEGQRGEASDGQKDGNSADSSDKKSKEVFQRQFETHDLLRAIDRKDTQLILTIRDVNFDLLLDLNQGGGGSMSSGTVNTPLGYCIGLGKGWEGVAVVLTGALSKFINNLPDEEEEEEISASHQDGGHQDGRIVRRARRELDPRTMSRLRKLRTSLKLAIE